VAPRGTAVLALVLAALIPAGCGGDDDGVSRDGYAKRVNKVCDDAERQLRKLDIGSAETSAEVGALIDDVIAKSRAAIDRLKALERPSGDAGETADRFVATLEGEFAGDALPALDDLKAAIRSGDRGAAADAADRLSELENTESDRFARQLGAEACAA
jgi:hypothetical protein